MNKKPWIESESNITKEEWETHQNWFLSFCGNVLGELIENGRYYKVKATKFDYGKSKDEIKKEVEEVKAEAAQVQKDFLEIEYPTKINN
jgi:hypothetical protein